MIEFRFSGLRADEPILNHPADIFIRVTADLELITEAGLIYAEPDFPVVELAADISAWMDTGARKGQDFEFDSMETPEPGWIWIRRFDERWRVGSIHQDRVDSKLRGLDEIRSAIRTFLSKLSGELRQQWSIDLYQFVQRGKGDH